MNGSVVGATLIEPSLAMPLGSDSPQVHPTQDAYGYAPFARAIASAARNTPGPKGLVMAIDAPWGAGKTSLLNFVRHYLTDSSGQAPADMESAPVVIDFNPWWFADRDQLAAQFLAQISAQFPAENEVLMACAEAMSTYADAIGSAVSTSIAASTGVKLPLLDKMVAYALGRFRTSPKDVPKLKATIAEKLAQSGRRFVVFVDDIDRLAPDEIREVFKVIKALADFPNVVYLLAFDRQLVSQALRSSLNIEDGDAYVEKIVQAQFSLPAVDHDLLVAKLIADLNELFGDIDAPEFATTYWGNVFHDGLSPLIQRPRDVVRIINSLLVTFPAVRGEVNPVDFIALEFLRVFVPPAYAAVRDNLDYFTGTGGREGRRERERTFHDAWLASLDETYRTPVKALLQRLFPRLQSVWGNTFFAAEHVREWNRLARVCSPEMSDVYFQFGVPPTRLSRAELRAFIALNDETDALERAWSNALDDRRTDGSTRAHQLLLRLIELDDLGVDFARSCLRAVFRIGDRLLAIDGDRVPGFYSIHASVQFYWLVHHLAKCLPTAEREPLFLDLARSAVALSAVCHITSSIDNMHQPDAGERDSVFREFSPETVAAMRTAVVERLRHLAGDGRLLDLPELFFNLHLWDSWGRPDDVSTWLGQMVGVDATLLRVLRHALRVGSSQSHGDRVARRVLSMNPRDIERYLPPAIGLEDLAARVEVVAGRNPLTDDDKACIQAFRLGMEALRQREIPERAEE
ncbi:P-loop NTPase fold protein [Burkholderia cepacia]|uniref:KAP family P-loop NTPase fold protein n=1 Tax=Burkholderia cepacia TaxID=292 RepID=UPI0009BEA33B|nr:P-loop NTPase fold protein [Burkholderia cepacia]